MDSSTEGFKARRINWFALSLFVFVGIYLLLRAPGYPEIFDNLHSDSAMRLVTIRDFLAGQGLHDLTQYRLGLESGTEMHWSRLVDIPIAGIILLFYLFFERQQAEYAALLLWPLLMFGFALWLAVRIMSELGDSIAVLFASWMIGINLATEIRFQPGVIDHHNIQVVLLLAVVLAVVTRHCPWLLAALAGIAMALSLSIGVEIVPLLAVCFLGVTCIWILRGNEEQFRVLAFSAGLGLGLPILFLISAPNSAYQGGFCDALSRDLAVPVILVAASLAITATTLSHTTVFRRGAFVTILFTATAFVTVLYFPACLSNPLDSLDPYLKTLWLNHVSETLGIAGIWDGKASWMDMHAGYFPLGVLTVIFSLALALGNPKARFEWLFIAALIALSLAITTYQIRGALTLKVLSVFPLAGMASFLRHRWKKRYGTGASLSVWFLVIPFLPISWALGFSIYIKWVPSSEYAKLAESNYIENKAECWSNGVGEILAKLPTGVVSANSNLGADILLHSPHRVLSAPYHRNQAGMIAQLQIAMAKNSKIAQQLLHKYGVDYLLSCNKDPELSTLAKSGNSGFGYELEQGKIPDFLTPVPMPDQSATKLYHFK